MTTTTKFGQQSGVIPPIAYLHRYHVPLMESVSLLPTDAVNKLSMINTSNTEATSGVCSSNISTSTTKNARRQVIQEPSLVMYPFSCSVSYMELIFVSPKGKFSGENESEAGECFTYWMNVCHWYDHT